jgi:acyl-CoA hydrolase
MSRRPTTSRHRECGWTEYGVIDLRGKSTKQRGEAFIGIAHPNFRDELMAAARKVTLVSGVKNDIY